jgi:transcriptional regulator with XRE-family HTH domain/tetratricopeptide (TPR) repeat protein
MGNPELARWLRRQRQDRGWSQSRLAREIISAALADGDHEICGDQSMIHNVYRWERRGDGPTDRYRPHVARALGIPLWQFGPGPHEAPPPKPPAAQAAQTVILALPPGSPAVLSGTVIPATPGAHLSAPANLAYGGEQAPEMGEPHVRQEVLMAAHESSESASRAEERGIGDMTLEQFHADVSRLSREYMTGDPFALFLEMRRVRDRMDSVLERRMWPRDARDLYLLLGCINDLMAIAAYDLGYSSAAEEFLRAAWMYAVAADHHALMARVRVDSANNVYWDQPKRSAELAVNGLEYLSEGPGGAYIFLKRGRAAARIGEADTARRALAQAREAHDPDYSDDLLTIGGEFNFSRASHRYLAGATLIEIPGAEQDAGTELEQAIELYDRGPEPGEDHAQSSMMCARIDLASARLRAGQLDGAATALDPVFSLPTALRRSGYTRRLRRVRKELAAPIFAGSSQANALAERIEEYGREAITAGLHGLSGGPH